MNPHQLLLSKAAGLALACVATPLSAQTRWWDGGVVDIPTNGDGAATNASGTWSTAIANWDQGSGLAHVAWNNAGNNTAQFSGGTNTITLATDVSVGRINQFGGGSGINITEGAGLHSINLGSATTIFSIAATATTARAMTVTAEVTGSSNLSIVGPATTAGGFVNLNRVNTYTGTTSVNNTTLRIGNGGTAAQLNNGNYSAAISLATASSFFVYGSSLNQTLGGNITGSGRLTKETSASTLVLAGTNSYSGGTNVNLGTLTFRNTAAKPATGTVTVAAGATLGLGVATAGSFFTSANVDDLFAGTLSGVTNDAASNVGIDTTPGNFTYSTSVGGAPSRGLVKLGANKLTLTGNSTYTGTTTVAEGVLAVDGTLANTATTVANTATLQGGGAIGGSVTIQTGGTLAAGNSIGSLGTGALDFAAGSTFSYELETALYGSTPNDSADLIHATGTVDITDGAVLTLTDLATTTALALGSKLTLISYSGGWTAGELFTYNLATLNDGATFTLGVNDWLFNYDDTTGGLNSSADQSGAARFVTMTVIPEPQVAGLLGGFALIHLLRRRRTRNP